MIRNIGIVGMPPREVMFSLKKEGVKIYDLDALHVKPDLEITASYIPRVYCAILRTVLTNAKKMSLDAIYIDVGEGKCSGALYIAEILKVELNIPVIQTRNEDKMRFGNPVCESDLPLVEKMELITQSVLEPEAMKNDLVRCEPVAGFWGVPPRDFSILSLFPPRTHVFGWTRCMENKTPADAALEKVVHPDVPTVFFAQSFCQKTALTYYLARRHPCGLYVDADVYMGHSTKSKVQAFLELNGAID
ncbi:MAG: hypothetical protein Q8O60_07535 [Deltaproteobacteria bacterium]|nr:hypothetical protein [Deltaproteobacteria bacterium]